MTKKLEVFNKHVAIAGFKNVKIKDINGFLEDARRKVKDHVQFFDAKFIASQQHLYFAALNALRAFEKKLNISSSLTVEALLYASAQRQIKKAVDKLGIKPNCSQIAVLVMAETKQKTDVALETVSELISGERDDDVLELTAEKFEGIKTLFDVSDSEIEAKSRKKGLEREALINLVIEHMALLAIQR